MTDVIATECTCWKLVRKDGRIFAFTDHDAILSCEGITFQPDDGLTARALEQTTGLSVDNSEAIGALSASGLSESDILSGRYDGAKVEIWRVDWSSAERRAILFVGEIGEIERSGAAFKAELRGLSELLNRPQGQLYQRQCRASLGDAKCGVDLAARGMIFEAEVIAVDGPSISVPFLNVPVGQFANGVIRVLNGDAEGSERRIREDLDDSTSRMLCLWDGIPGVQPGDVIALTVGCGKTADFCRIRFDNMANFRGFPHLPSEDWLTGYPGGSR